jgi:protein-tyrosine phosphatase
MGNICRSPSAQGVFEKLIHNKGLSHLFEVDSAGTHSYHVGSAADPRSISFAQKRGIDLTSQHARQAKSRDFEKFDYIIAMDDDNFENLKQICPSSESENKLFTMMNFSENKHYTEIPDPYYGGAGGFDLVLDLLEEACNGLLKQIL